MIALVRFPAHKHGLQIVVSILLSIIPISPLYISCITRVYPLTVTKMAEISGAEVVKVCMDQDGLEDGNSMVLGFRVSAQKGLCNKPPNMHFIC